MGLLSTYVIYKYGKNKGAKRTERRQQLTNTQLELVCDTCGYKLRQHSDDGNLSCPSF